MRTNTPLYILAALALSLLLTACAGAPTAAVTPTRAAPSAAPTDVPTVLPTNPPAPTETDVPLPSLTPTAAETTPTATLAPTADPALASVKLIGLAWYADYDLLLSFQFPGPVDAANYRVTLEDKEYKCEVLKQFPDRLYCKGQGAKVLTTAMVRVYPAGSDAPVFEKTVWVPYFE